MSEDKDKKTGDDDNEDKSKDEQLAALMAEKTELTDKNARLEEDAKKAADEQRILDDVFLEQGLLKEVADQSKLKEEEEKPKEKENAPPPVDADGKFDHKAFREQIMADAQKIVDSEKEKVAEELRAMQVTQAVSRFKSEHADFEALRPEMIALAKKSPTISLESAYAQASLDRDTAKLAADKAEFEKVKTTPRGSERHAAGGDRQEKPKTWQEVLDDKYAEHYDTLHAYDDFDQS